LQTQSKTYILLQNHRNHKQNGSHASKALSNTSKSAANAAKTMQVQAEHSRNFTPQLATKMTALPSWN